MVQVRGGIVSVLMLLVCSMFVNAQQTIPVTASTAVPRLINFNGTLTDVNRQPLSGIVGVTFSLYRYQQGGAPLWLETQNVRPDMTGRYSVLLGSTGSQGVPASIFVSGEAHWLGVQVQGQDEQPRVALVSAPYALKAADAETVGGLPPSAFVLAAPGGANGVAPGPSSVATQNTVANIGGSGTQNYIPLWTDNSGDLGNSILYQLGTGATAKIGINEKNPLFTLDVNGAELVRGLLEMATLNYATPTKGYNSQAFNLESSAYNSGTAKYTLNHFQWQAEPSGNNTTTPGATLNLLYGTDPAVPAETGLSLSSKGIFTFAPGQTFPGGSGTVTSVGLSAPSTDFTVTGSPITTSGTLGLNWTVAPTNSDTANAIVKRDANGSFSAGPISASNTVASGSAISGIDTSTGGYGVQGSSNNIGVLGSGSLYGVYGSGFSYGVYATGNTAVYAKGITGINTYGSDTGAFLEGANYGVYASGSTAVRASGGAYGVYGSGGTGVYGDGGAGGEGVVGVSGNTAGVYAQSATGWAVDAFGTASATGVLAGSSTGYAAWFNGNVQVDGTLNATVKHFKIDHPLDPANQYLVHASVESSEMKNIYDGMVTTDARGEATVLLPAWFEALNTSFRYQLTVIGQFAQAIIARKIENHQFQIQTNAPNVEVSWQVTGVRQDAYAKANPMQVETEKPQQERGFYLHPELFGAPEEKGILWARSPQAMKQWKEAREKTGGLVQRPPVPPPQAH